MFTPVVTLATLALAVTPAIADMHHHAGFARGLRVRHAKRRLDTLVRRKTLGEGDSATVPSNVAAGSDADSCKCWHSVGPGEVCLGLIDKSSAGFTLEKFYQLNPSLDNDCSNLVVGLSYCVDTVASTGNSTDKVNSAAASAADALVAIKGSASASASASCDDDEDEDEYEDDDDTADTSTTWASSTYAAAAIATTPSATAAAQVQAIVDYGNTWSSSSSSANQNTWEQQNTWAAQDVSTSNTWEQQNTWAAATSSSQTQAAATTEDSSGGISVGLGELFTGQATFYYQGGVAGSCGIYHKDSDYVAAVFNNNYGSSNCGRQAKVTNTATGASVTVTVVDSCPSCGGLGHIDLSVAAFNVLGSESQGVLPTTWQYIS